jgi:type IV secretory pathway VirB6-like protein
MGRVVAVVAGAAVLALQIWLTLYAQVVLAYEAAVLVVVLLGLGPWVVANDSG